MKKPILRCNAVNIIRQRENDADEEDVVIVKKCEIAKSLIDWMKNVVDIIVNKLIRLW